MSNKLYGDNVKDYFVDGKQGKGYFKGVGKGYGDGKTSSGVKNFDSGVSVNTVEGSRDWFEGKKGSVGHGGVGATGV